MWFVVFYIFSMVVYFVPQVEEQRRYLGGDKDHTILVKGLDFALLEQNKARSMLSREEDDDSLEAAFQEAQPSSVIPKKRTREDIIRELKEKRTSGSQDAATAGEPTADEAFEAAKRVGKFKPIGASNHSTSQEHSKVTKGKSRDKGGEQKKKRRKVKQGVESATDVRNTKTPLSQTTIAAPSGPPLLPPPQPGTSSDSGARVLEPAQPAETTDEVDIFADAGEYEGVDFGEDEDEERPAGSINAEKHMVAAPKPDGVASKGWFTEDEPVPLPGPSSVAIPSPPPTAENIPAELEEPEPEQITRLAPLASSALPSISDFLAMDAQAEALQKRKAKKEKKKGGEKKEKLNTEVKVDRDYKKSVKSHSFLSRFMGADPFLLSRLSSYMAKKGGGSIDV